MLSNALDRAAQFESGPKLPDAAVPCSETVELIVAEPPDERIAPAAGLRLQRQCDAVRPLFDRIDFVRTPVDILARELRVDVARKADRSGVRTEPVADGPIETRPE